MNTKQIEGEFKQLIAFAQKHRGTIKHLADALTKRAKRTIFRQYVEQWLNPDESKRIEPKLWIGIMLIEEGKKLLDGSVKV